MYYVDGTSAKMLKSTQVKTDLTVNIRVQKKMIRFFQSIRHNDNKLSFQTCMKNKTVNGQI